MMPFATILFMLLQAPAPPSTPELAVIHARLGTCSADFTVADAAGAPVYGAIVHVRIRYGFMGLKRMDLEVGTNSDGKARVDTLPEKGRLLVYDVTKDDRKATVEQDLETTCKGTYNVALK